MIQTYHFFGEHSLEFEDSKTVKELIEYAFEKFDSNVIIPIVIMDGLQSTRKEDALMKSSIEMNFVLVIIFRGFYIMRKADGVIIWRN